MSDPNVTSYFDAVRAGLEAPALRELGATARYQILWDLYQSNGLYEPVGSALVDAPAIKPLRNPAFRVAEFYASVLWPGTLPQALPIIAENTRLIEPLYELWAWSNWTTKKQELARTFPALGDCFIKVNQKADGRPYLHLIDPRHVLDFDLDERDFVSWIRLDVPSERRNGDTGKLVAYTHVEVWEKGRVRVWETDKGPGVELSKLKTPLIERVYSETANPAAIESGLSFDFVPIVHGRFRGTGDKYGEAAVMPALDKIHEANRQATRLHQLLYRYNKADMALEGQGKDSTGKPLAPPSIGNGGDTIDLNDETFYRLPAGWTIKHLIAQLDYSAALNILNAQIDELTEDLPELAYGKLFSLNSLVSGVAIRYRLMPALSRALEARGNGESAMIRAMQMALTIGQNAGVWSDLGDYATGDLDFSFVEREVIPIARQERAETTAVYTGAGVPLLPALDWTGHSDEEIAAAKQGKRDEQAAQQQTLASAVLSAQRSMDSGAADNGLIQPAGDADAAV